MTGGLIEAHARLGTGDFDAICSLRFACSSSSNAARSSGDDGFKTDSIIRTVSSAMARSDFEAAGHTTPLRAVRLHCVECCGGSSNEVRHCSATSCPLWPCRFGRRPNAEEKAVVAEMPTYPLERRMAGASALRAARKRCIDCSGGTDAAVRACTFSDCALHRYRFGKNPNIVRSDEWKLAATERLASLKRPAPSLEPIEAADFRGAQDRPRVVSPKTVAGAT
jgi:hypothetical protein